MDWMQREREEIPQLSLDLLKRRERMFAQEADIEQYRAELALERHKLGVRSYGPDGSWEDLAKLRQRMADSRRARAKMYNDAIKEREAV